MRQLGLFGGSFDPVHNAHLTLAEKALELAKLDHIIFIPNGISPFKNELSASCRDRLSMLRLAIEGNECFSVSSYETERPGISYTYDTLCAFRRFYPEDMLFFIIGDDGYQSFPHWYKSQELLTLCTFLVFTRNGGEIKAPFVPISVPPMDVSSTEVRRRLREGDDVGALLPSRVESYIKEHALYQLYKNA